MWRSLGYFVCVGVNTIADVSDTSVTPIFRIEVDPKYEGSTLRRNFSGTAHFVTVGMPRAALPSTTNHRESLKSVT
jgi:hypothetical protein